MNLPIERPKEINRSDVLVAVIALLVLLIARPLFAGPLEACFRAL
jgi:hypothetical protein